ncbi:MAG: reverse transcriptase [Clostridiales bacterium]|nr:reverse transcriptase [Clostridiales bacterium]
MKLHGDLFSKIVSDDNLKLAHFNAKKGKGWYQEVKKVNENVAKDTENNFGEMLQKLQQDLINHTYHTSNYNTIRRKEGKKVRDLYKLPYYPDRIAQWAVIQVIEPILIRHLIFDTYSALPNRGIHLGLERVQHVMRHDVPGCQYCLKIDAKHYYQSINHEILKDKFRRLFKDNELLWFIDEVIGSVETADESDKERLSTIEELSTEVLSRYIWGRKETPEERKLRYENSGIGLPIGNYFSQYGGNFYFSEFDHFMKENIRVKYYFRYMDDIVIFGSNKEYLHKLCWQINHYFQTNLRITMKENYQVFPTYVRGVDYLGFRSFLNYTLLRKSTCQSYKHKMLLIAKKVKRGAEISYSDYCSFNSYKGWLLPCDHYRLYEKYGVPLEKYVDAYYVKNIQSRKGVSS